MPYFVTPNRMPTTRSRADSAKLHRLSAKAVEKAKAGVHPTHGADWGKDYTLADGGGLYLLVKANGSRLWQYGYRFGGKEQTLSIGEYPYVPLSAAREKYRSARELLAAGKNPIVEKRLEKQRAVAETFGALFVEWVSTQKPNWAPSNLNKINGLAQANLLPYLKDRPIKDVRPDELLAVLRRIEKRDALDLARRCGSILAQVFGLALASGRAESNPALGLNRLLQKPQTEHRAAITDPEEIATLMRSIEAYRGGAVVGAALKLSALTFLRPGELRQAEWADINFDSAEWLIPVQNRKLQLVQKRRAKPHWVPLSQQAIDELKELKALTGRYRFVFPGERSPGTRPMSDGAVLAALRGLGYGTESMSAHGFRGMATSSLMTQGWKREAIDRQLAHKDKDAVFSAYDRSDYREERRKMMQAWADYLDRLKRGERKVIPLRA